MERISIRILGLDPGLNRTGWGIVECSGHALHYVACGQIAVPAAGNSLGERLSALYKKLAELVEQHQPQEAAVEETFVNKNAASALKLGMARGVVMLAPSYAGLSVAEYSANVIKKAVSGYGHADKNQVAHMVKMLLPKAELSSPDAADALAVAICHAHHRQSPIYALEAAS
jgi:crossover junction endodeoxyribonuclease RuvC